ncbi:MAG: tetratricopeptide repeat protein [Saprospiraceae bacterium]|nr:tetratricopeptide repeat protein [Saprospiraceae bacterium]
MNRSFFTAALLFFSTLLIGQEKVTVLTVTGHVNYFTGASNIGKRVLPGQLLPAIGFLRCDDGASAMLIFNGQRYPVKSQEELDLKKIPKEKKRGNRMGYLGRFFKFIGSSVNNTEDNDKLEKHHERYMTSVGGVRGFGQTEAAIKTFGYLSGPIGGGTVTFHWKYAGQVPFYAFEIWKEGEEERLMMAKVRANQIDVDLDQLSINPGEVYHWKVTATAKDGEEVSTVEVPFSLESEALAELLSGSRLEKMQEKVEEGEKELVVLQQLQEQGFKHAAYSKYESMLQQDADNLLVKRLFASFLVENNDLERAKALIAGIQ